MKDQYIYSLNGIIYKSFEEPEFYEGFVIVWKNISGGTENNL